MASQLLPLGAVYHTTYSIKLVANIVAELIDKCVGSKIWVVMKGDKGSFSYSSFFSMQLTECRIQWHSRRLRRLCQ